MILKRVTKGYSCGARAEREAVREGRRGGSSSTRGLVLRMKECSGAHEVERSNEENDHAIKRVRRVASFGKKAGVPSVISINPFNKTELSGRGDRFILQMTD